MPQLSPVDYDPFTPPTPQLIPVDNDPFTPPQQLTGPARLPLMAASNVAEGLGGLLSTPGDVAQLYDAYIGAPFSRAVAGQSPQFGKLDPNASAMLAKALPPSSQVLPALKSSGVIKRPDLKPDGLGEDLFSGAMRGVGGNLPLALIGGGALSAAKTLAQGLGAGIGQEAADKIAPGSIYGSLFGSLAGGGIASGAANLAERGVNALSGAVSPILQAYKEAGVTPRLAGDVSGNPAMQQIQAYAAKSMGGASQIEKAADASLNEFGKSVEGLANNLGNSQTLQEAGDVLQSEGKSWLKTWNTAKEQAWNIVDNIIGTTTPIKTNEVKNAVNTITSQAQGNQELGNILKSPIVKNTIDVLDSGKGILTWGQASALRTHVGQMLENPMLVSGPEQAQAKLLYGALTKDMQNGAFTTGNRQALLAFQNANTLTSKGHDFIDNVLGDVMKADPEKAASSMLSSGVKGGTQLQALRQQMPSAADELASVSLRRTMAGQSQGSSGNAVSPSRWLSNQDPTRRLSPQAFQALYPNAATQSKISALDTVAAHMRDTDKFLNRSNTGTHMSMTMPVLAGIEGARTGHEMAGLPGAIIGGLGGGAALPLMGYGAGKISTNSLLAKLMATPSSGNPYGFLPSVIPEISKQMQPFSLAPQVNYAQ